MKKIKDINKLTEKFYLNAIEKYKIVKRLCQERRLLNDMRGSEGAR